MTERNSVNGWCDAKIIRRFLLSALLLNITAWILEAAGYRNDLENAIEKVKLLERADVTSGAEVCDFLQKDYCLFGLMCMVFLTVFLGIVVVHRESFKENWYVTLRRIPDYRGKYLKAKLSAVLFPGTLYVVYYILQWLFRWGMYCKHTPEGLRTGRADELWKLVPIKSIGEIILYMLLFALSILLGSLVLRRIKKDIPGGIVALGGLVMTVLLFTEAIWFTNAWELLAVLLFLISIVTAFLVRHVYYKL